MMKRRRVVLQAGMLAAALAVLMLMGCASAAAHSPQRDAPMYAEAAEESWAADDQRQQERAPQTKARSADDEGSGEQPRTQRLLIYTGTVVLAIFEVAQTQEAAIEVVEALDGYVQRRTSDRLILRVPAASFRQALDALTELGDVLDVNWQAQDVSDEVRDLDIRLKNALEMRDRLEALLDRADTVEDALRIEAELERITLEIERIRGRLISFEDRIAYSTIEVVFRRRQVERVPDDEFWLPFRWLNDLGLPSLLQEPRRRR